MRRRSKSRSCLIHSSMGSGEWVKQLLDFRFSDLIDARSKLPAASKATASSLLVLVATCSCTNY